MKQGLIEKDLDVAFLLGPVNDERIHGIKYATYEYCWVASPKIGLIAHNLYTAKKIAERYPIITDSPKSTIQQELRIYLESVQTSNPKLLSCASYTSISELAVQGAGIALLPKRLAGSKVNDGRLVTIMTDWTPTPMHFSGSYLIGPDNQLANRLIQYVKSLL